jgi:hypothetical protein
VERDERQQVLVPRGQRVQLRMMRVRRADLVERRRSSRISACQAGILKARLPGSDMTHRPAALQASKFSQQKPPLKDEIKTFFIPCVPISYLVFIFHALYFFSYFDFLFHT